jgi:hypothetical protein
LEPGDGPLWSYSSHISILRHLDKHLKYPTPIESRII